MWTPRRYICPNWERQPDDDDGVPRHGWASKLAPDAAPARRTYGAVAKAALGVAGVGAVAALRGSDVGASVSSALFGSPTAALDDAPGGGSELSFYVWSDYTDTYGDVGTSYTWYSDGGYAGIVEPYVPQTLVADCAACSPDTTYTWTFSGGETAFGNEVERMFYALETYDVQVSATAGDSVLASYAGTVVCRYVRREIRQLSSTDRNRFFDAMKFHVTLSSDIKCDHMHDGIGFLTMHVGLALALEQALQAVDNRVALPYWDYTIDKYMYDSGNWTSMKSDSPLWQNDWFGHTDSANTTINAGRWAYIEVEIGTYTALPSCEVHYYTLSKTYTWSDFGWVLPYEPHGPVHMFVGGTKECDTIGDKVESYLDYQIGLSDDDGEYETIATYAEVGNSSNYTVSGNETVMASTNGTLHQREVKKLMYLLRTDMFVSLKNMYRAGYLEFPDYCSLDTNFSDCHATCMELDQLQDAITDKDDTYIEDYWEMMFAWSSATDSYTWLSHEVKVTIIRMVCEGGFAVDGDQLESGSPMDPAFWPIHGTVERLWLYKKLLGFTNEGWPDDYSTVSECFGHNATDLIPFSFSLIDTDTDDDDDAVSIMANMSANELYDKMGPDSMAMPYVYQDFDWDHCSHAGFDFTGIDTSAEVTDDVLDMTPTDVDEAAAPPSLDDDADDARRKLTGASMTREEIVAFRWQLYKMTVPEYIQDLF
ncbi:symporter [Aureococcus anophagefferens]|nr:symporter [Aureococcus anophagefferens]